MAIARDASSPVRFNLSSTTASTGTESGTSASFTPPANAWIYASACINNTAGSTPTFNSPTNTGGGLGSWTLVKSQNNASGGSVAVWRAFVNSSVATTVTISVTTTGAPATQNNDAAGWVDVWTGAATTQTGAATAGGTSTTVNFSPTITTTASGSQVAGVAIDWAAAGTPTSTDTIDGYTQTSQTSGGRAYKASNSGGAGSVAVNFHSPGTPQWAYALYEILAPAGAVTVALTGQSSTFAAGSLAPSTSVPITGTSATFSSGTLVPGLSIALLGQSGTFTSGLLVPSTSVPLTGQSATFTSGALSANGDVTINLTGQSATLIAGILSPAIAVALNGQPITSAAGSLIPSSSLALTGVGITSSTGTVSPSTTVPLQGQSSTFTPGQLGIVGDVTVALTGISAVFTAGNISVAPPLTADAGRRRVRSIYRITIDGQTFEFSTLQEALDLLAKAKEIAVKKAPEVVKPGTPPPMPVITANTRELRPAITETKREIAKVYRQALIDVEIAQLMELDDRSKHNEDVITFLM